MALAPLGYLPDMKVSSNPACSISLAEKASNAHGISWVPAGADNQPHSHSAREFRQAVPSILICLTSRSRRKNKCCGLAASCGVHPDLDSISGEDCLQPRTRPCWCNASHLI